MRSPFQVSVYYFTTEYFMDEHQSYDERVRKSVVMFSSQRKSRQVKVVIHDLFPEDTGPATLSVLDKQILFLVVPVVLLSNPA